MSRASFSLVRLFTTVLALAALMVGISTTTYAAVPTLGGSLKSLNLRGEDVPGLLPSYSISSNRLRLESTWAPIEPWQLETALDHQLLWTDPDDILPLPTEGINRHLDLDKSWQHGSGWASRLQVDRLALRYQGRRSDLVIGRQAVGFGRILLFSPLDIIAPFAPDAIDTDVRPGVDAVRGTLHYGLDGQLGGIFVWGDEGRHNSTILTWSDNRHGVDLLAIGGRLRSRPILGGGLAGSLGPLGLKGEIAFYDGQRVNEPGEDLHDSFSIAALEAWHRFDNGVTLITQYLYNGPGVGDPADYPRVAASAPLREGLTYLLGRHYLMMAPSYELHPLVTLQGLFIWNLEDDSILIRPALSCDLADNLALELYWETHTGASPRQSFPPLPPTPTSEFGLRGDNAAIFLKYFF